MYRAGMNAVSILRIFPRFLFFEILKPKLALPLKDRVPWKPQAVHLKQRVNTSCFIELLQKGDSNEAPGDW
jgi:hypothetical protein